MTEWETSMKLFNFELNFRLLGVRMFDILLLTYTRKHLLAALESSPLLSSPLLSREWQKKHFQQIKFFKALFLGRGMANKYEKILI